MAKNSVSEDANLSRVRKAGKSDFGMWLRKVFQKVAILAGEEKPEGAFLEYG